jgi:hypothetical protein
LLAVLLVYYQFNCLIKPIDSQDMNRKRHFTPPVLMQHVERKDFMQ